MISLTNKEEEIMQALWSLNTAFVKEIVKKLDGNNHYNTVSTVVRNLEDKNFVGYKAFGKTHQYYPLITKEQYTKQFMNSAMKLYFNDNYKSMVSFFAKEEKISAEELREILELIENPK